MRYLAKICYDGSKFQGFQRLNNGKGVQNELERVLSILENQKVVVKGAGRTDALVHAFHQCVHFDFTKNYSEEKLKYAMNRLLNPYVSVSSVLKVDDSFHARYSVKEKTYEYKIYVGEKNPFYASYAYFFYQPLSLEKMKECAKCFLGTHDFYNFVSGERGRTISNIHSIDIVKKQDFILVTVKGKSFYRYMVRSIVGALVDVGCGRKTSEEVKRSLDRKSDMRFSVLPPQGLYLMNIDYD